MGAETGKFAGFPRPFNSGRDVLVRLGLHHSGHAAHATHAASATRGHR